MRRDSNRVKCEVEEAKVELNGRLLPGVCVTCSRCDHKVEVAGTSGRSVRRALVQFREDCPNGEDNFYTAEEAEED